MLGGKVNYPFEEDSFVLSFPLKGKKCRNFANSSAGSQKDEAEGK